MVEDFMDLSDLLEGIEQDGLVAIPEEFIKRGQESVAAHRAEYQGEYVMGKGGGGSQPSSTTTTTEVPAFIKKRLENLYSRAEGESMQDYQTYGLPRIAGFSGDETDSFDMTRGNVGNYQPSFDAASAGYSDVGGGFNPAEFSKYMGTYTGGVTDRIAELGNRNLMENILPGVNDSFIRSGQFGSSRNRDFTLDAIRDTQNEVTGNQAMALQKAFESAMGNYQTGQGQKLNAATGMQELGKNTQAAGMADAGALEAIGKSQRGMDQANLDLAKGDFDAQNNWNKNQLGWFSDVIRGTPTGNMGTVNQTSTTPQPNPLAQLAGLGAGTYYATQSMKAKGGAAKKKPDAYGAMKNGAAKKSLERGIGGNMRFSGA